MPVYLTGRVIVCVAKMLRRHAHMENRVKTLLLFLENAYKQELV